MRVVLASASPRRKEILSMVCSNFEIRVSNADEKYDKDTPHCDVPSLLAKIKAEAVPLYGDEIIIGCDTVVICDNEIMGKPRDRADAIRMLTAYSGREHLVVSGIALRTKDKLYTESVVSRVYMRELSLSEIEKYVDTAKPYDKAGAYGIQEMAGAFVSRIDGDFYNIVGLPLCRLTELLRDEFGVLLI